jgi:hypothetical protein
MAAVSTTVALAGGNAARRPAGQPGGGTEAGRRPPAGRAGLAALASLAVNFVIPLLAYYLIQRRVGSSAVALALAGVIPVAWTLVMLAARRRLDPLGVISVILFGIGVLISWACGGNTLALELQDPEVTGPAGVACLVSVAIGRPLHPVILRLLGRGNAAYADIADRVRGKTAMTTTTVLGLTLLVHAAALTALALTQTPGTFVALQHPVGLPPLAVGLGGLYLYRNRLRARQAAATATATANANANANAASDELPDGQAAGDPRMPR